MERVAFYETDAGAIYCDPCSIEICRRNHALALHRTYAATSTASYPSLTCEACGKSHVVKQS